MSEVRAELIKIIKDAEKEQKLPIGILQDIFTDEADLIYLDFRNNYTSTDGKLRRTLLQYFEQYKKMKKEEAER